MRVAEDRRVHLRHLRHRTPSGVALPTRSVAAAIAACARRRAAASLASASLARARSTSDAFTSPGPSSVASSSASAIHCSSSFTLTSSKLSTPRNSPSCSEHSPRRRSSSARRSRSRFCSSIFSAFARLPRLLSISPLSTPSSSASLRLARMSSTSSCLGSFMRRPWSLSASAFLRASLMPFCCFTSANPPVAVRSRLIGGLGILQHLFVLLMYVEEARRWTLSL